MLKKIANKKIVTTAIVFLLIFLGNIFFDLIMERRLPCLYQQKDYLEVIYLDIGQGDATLIRTTGSKNILIDGGPDLSLVYELGKVLPFYERRIDLMILTHPDQDHMYGLVEVLKRYQVDKILLNGIDDQTADYIYFLSIVNEYAVPIDVVHIGDEYFFEDLRLVILYPFEDLLGKKVDDSNSSSLAIRIDYGQTSFLFTGDLPTSRELELVAKNIDLKVNVLKAGHHGSKTSSNLEFLQTIMPEYVIISSGKKNRFGHPHFRVLKNISKVGAQILRTDKIGTIKLISDGEKVLLLE